MYALNKECLHIEITEVIDDVVKNAFAKFDSERGDILWPCGKMGRQ